ncbi:MAG: hypothetical protein ACUVQV_02870 [Dissulfurimicrobium sp.]|uniref:hypothetical protein n=1 Tax=Dissulfurimicrobium sp. TaxID=2022436 RepID=UPI004049AF6E
MAATKRTDIMSTGYFIASVTNEVRLLNFFAMTDKESPAQGNYYGWSAPFGAGASGANFFFDIFTGYLLYHPGTSTLPSKQSMHSTIRRRLTLAFFSAMRSTTLSTMNSDGYRCSGWQGNHPQFRQPYRSEHD